MAESELKAVLRVDDRTKAGIDTASSNFDKLKGTALKLGAVVAGAFAVGKIMEFGKASFDAFVEAEASAARVSATLATMGAKGKEAAGEIDRLSAAAVKLGFDDEDAAESVTKLFQATGNMTEATKLNALAMDLARAKQIDLGDATRIVTLMLSGNVKELRMLGIEAEEGATALENIGKVQAAVSGQAQAFSETTAGQMATLSVAVGNFQETLGQSVATGMQPFLEKLVEISQNEEFKAFVVSAADLVGKTLLVAFKAVGATVDALSTGFFVLIQAWEAVSKFWKENVEPIFKAMGDFIQGVIDKVNSLIAALDALAKKASGAFSGIGSTIMGATGFGGKRADGGPVASGTTYLVGERGPELFMPQTNGTIIPNMGMAGGGITVNINGGMFLDEYAADMVGTKMVDRLRSQFRF